MHLFSVHGHTVRPPGACGKLDLQSADTTQRPEVEHVSSCERCSIECIIVVPYGKADEFCSASEYFDISRPVLGSCDYTR